MLMSTSKEFSKVCISDNGRVCTGSLNKTSLGVIFLVYRPYSPSLFPNSLEFLVHNLVYSTYVKLLISTWFEKCGTVRPCNVSSVKRVR